MPWRTRWAFYSRGRCQHCAWRTVADAVLALLLLQAQPCFSIHTEQPLVVHAFAFTCKQHLEPPITIARFLPGQLDKPLLQVFIAPCGLVSIARYRQQQQPASIRPSAYGLRLFFAITPSTSHGPGLGRPPTASNGYSRLAANVPSGPPWLPCHRTAFQA